MISSKHSPTTATLLLVAIAALLTPMAAPAGEESRSAENLIVVSAVDAVLDGFHQAASAADEER